MNNAILFEENGIWVLASYKRYAGKYKRYAGKARKLKLCLYIAMQKSRADAASKRCWTINRRLRLGCRKCRRVKTKNYNLSKQPVLPRSPIWTLGPASRLERVYI
jgi:hypothetical protein